MNFQKITSEKWDVGKLCNRPSPHSKRQRIKKNAIDNPTSQNRIGTGHDFGFEHPKILAVIKKMLINA